MRSARQSRRVYPDHGPQISSPRNLTRTPSGMPESHQDAAHTRPGVAVEQPAARYLNPRQAAALATLRQGGPLLPDDDPAPPSGRLPRLCHSPEILLRFIPLQQRRQIYEAYHRLGGGAGHLSDQGRAVLSEAIYAVEDELEHRQGDHPAVMAMRTVRNWLYDDLGWNDYPPGRQPTSLPPPHAPGRSVRAHAAGP